MARPRTPTAILKARGSKWARHREAEPAPKVGIPKCPRWVSKEAKKHWAKIVEELDAMGVMTMVDAVAAGILVEALAAYIDARDVAKDAKGKAEYYTVNDKGGRVANPVIAARNAAMKALMDCCSAFGMTPAARTKLKATPREETKKDAKDEFKRSAVG